MADYSRKLFNFLSGELYPYLNFLKKSFKRGFNFEKSKGEEVKVDIFNINYRKYEPEIKEVLKEIGEVEKKFLSPHGKLILHGSFGTHDYTKFSDIDLLLILNLEKCEFLKVKRGIKKILNIIFSFDYTQHHGVFIIPEETLKFYPEWFLPISSLKKGKSFSGEINLKLKPFSDIDFSRERFLNFLDGILKNYESGIFLKNGYNLKHFISRVLLIPTLFLETRGENVYKGESFKIFYDLGFDRYQIISLFSEIRERWERGKNTFPFLEFGNPWFYHKINRVFFSKIEKHISNEFLKDIENLKLKEFFSFLRSKI